MILVTGAGGQAGTAIIRALATRGHAVRALTRSAASAMAARTAGAAEIATGDMTRADDVMAAARGVRAILHISPSQGGDEVRMGRCIIDAAENGDIERLVYLGSVNLRVDTEQHRDKAQVEREIVESRLPYVFLHPAKFMQGILPLWGAIMERGVFRVPYSVTSPLARVDLMDVGEAAVAALCEPGHFGATYELVGQPPISEAEVCEMLTARLGRPVTAEMISSEEWQHDAEAKGMGAEQIRRSAHMFAFFSRLGSPHESTLTLRALIGRAPTSFATFLDRIIADGAMHGNAVD